MIGEDETYTDEKQPDGYKEKYRLSKAKAHVSSFKAPTRKMKVSDPGQAPGAAPVKPSSASKTSKKHDD